MNPTYTLKHTAITSRALFDAIDANACYAVTYHHEDGPLIGFIGYARENEEDIARWWVFEEDRTGELLRVCEDQLVSALVVDGPWLSDAEVNALI